MLEEPKIIIDNDKIDNLKNKIYEESKSLGIITFDGQIISSLLGRSSNEVKSIMGIPTGQDETVHLTFSLQKPQTLMLVADRRIVGWYVLNIRNEVV